ncbi:hypothetical protein XA68_10438 [Ophiocordyceps unilateralis]|uniref:Vacuolar protein sorting-associated protein 51 homolog n=1 Tax=Ophiocordyceps unilateralis TaxID=268505 RepID=A0A2A9PRS0_OPHUN|nr:hypothetical protein XA68_10438 [Ophiocordyceps unilateralis]
MSTIASPRDRPLPRRLPSTTTEANGSSSSSASPHAPPKARSNRAALREYYNLRSSPVPQRIDLPDSEVPTGELDVDDFDAAAYVHEFASRAGIEDLLRLYTRVVAEVRALDAEKKALVYDNYSKLISATETIRKMRASMDPLKPLASTLDPVIAQIYSQASSMREALRHSMPAPDSDEAKARDARARRRRTRQLAAEALAMPKRLRDLVQQGREDEARKQWDLPRRLLVSWRDKGVGGEDVQSCIDEGDAVFAPASEAEGPGR